MKIVFLTVYCICCSWKCLCIYPQNCTPVGFFQLLDLHLILAKCPSLESVRYMCRGKGMHSTWNCCLKDMLQSPERPFLGPVILVDIACPQYIMWLFLSPIGDNPSHGNNILPISSFILQKGQGAPAREPVISNEDQKQLMLFYHRRQEELKVSSVVEVVHDVEDGAANCFCNL